MKMKPLVVASAIAALVMPLSVGAAGDTASSAKAGSSGAEKTFEALDKNKDGFLSKDELKGSPHDKDFAKLDKNHDGKVSREEHGSTAMGATGGAASSGATGSSSGSSGGAQGKKY